MSEQPKDESQDVSRNPITEEMIEDIEHLIENYIPPFMERYEEKLKDVVLFESDNISSKDDLKQKIIAKLGIESLEDPLFIFIMHSVKPKIEPLLPYEETAREEALAQTRKTVSKIVDDAVVQINKKIEVLLTPGTEEETKQKSVNLDELDDDALLTEVMGDYVEIVEDSPDEPKEIETEIEDEIEEYPAVVTGLVDIPEEELVDEIEEPALAKVKTAESLKVPDLDGLKDRLTNKYLEKYSQELKDRVSDEEDLTKAKALLKKRIASIVDEYITKKNSE